MLVLHAKRGVSWHSRGCELNTIFRSLHLRIKYILPSMINMYVCVCVYVCVYIYFSFHLNMIQFVPRKEKSWLVASQ